MLELLRAGECCVCHIQARLDQRQAYISQHLNVLRQARIVSKRKEGVRVYYKVASLRVFDLMDAARTVLKDQGTWREENEMELAGTSKPCNCPQCVEVTQEQVWN
jgi:ArsR family transcriptional regulator